MYIYIYYIQYIYIYINIFQGYSSNPASNFSMMFYRPRLASTLTRTSSKASVTVRSFLEGHLLVASSPGIIHHSLVDTVTTGGTPIVDDYYG